MSEWARVTLADVVDRVTERNAEGHDRVMTVAAGRGLIEQEAYFNKRVASKDLSTYLVVQDGDFVYNKSTSATAAYGVVARYSGGVPGVVTPLYFAFRPKRDRVLPEYLLLCANGEEFFQSLAGMLREGARAHGLLNVRLADFYGATVALPPMSEQRRIVHLVTSVDAQIETLRAEQIRATESVRCARLALLTVGVQGPWQSQVTDSHTSLGWTETMPAGWRRETIGGVAMVRSGATPRRSEQAKYFDNGSIPWVKTGDLNERTIHATPESITEAGFAESSVRLLPADTVLVAMYGGFGQIGRTARLGVDSTTNQAISALTELRDDVLPAYLHQALKAGRPKWRLVAASSRKDPNISKRDVENFDFPLPPPDEQHEIVSLLEGAEMTADTLESELARLRMFRSTLLTSLLNQDIEIPEAYDSILKENVA